MSDREAFLAAIAANPGDDLPRLVYADWLDENGEPERAEFIRIQITLVRSPINSPLRTESTGRESELLKSWRSLLEPADRDHFRDARFRPTFSRGFLSEVVFRLSGLRRRGAYGTMSEMVSCDWPKLCNLFAVSPLLWKVDCPGWFYLVVVPSASGGWAVTRVLEPPPQCQRCSGRGRVYGLVPEWCPECGGSGTTEASRDFFSTGNRLDMIKRLLRQEVYRDLFESDSPSRM